MKSLVFHGPRDIRYESVADPVISEPRSAIIRVGKCGICGSDMHPYHHGPTGSPYCIGHEAIGEVVEVGSLVQRFKVGDRVAVGGSLCCGECDACLEGKSMICRNFPTCRVLGQNMHGLGGAQAEYLEVIVADFNLCHLPDSISDAVGIMLTDNLATGWAGAGRACARPGASVGVIGCGAVGLSAILAARAMGAERIFAMDMLPARRAAAAALGAIPVHGDNLIEELRVVTDGQGVDGMVDTVGNAGTAELDIFGTRRGGNACIVGLPQTPTIPFPMITGIARNITLSMAACSVQAEWPALLDALATGALDMAEIEAMCSHDLPLADGAAAYALFDSRAENVRKVLLTP